MYQNEDDGVMSCYFYLQNACHIPVSIMMFTLNLLYRKNRQNVPCTFSYLKMLYTLNICLSPQDINMAN